MIFVIDTHEFPKSALDNLFQIVDYSPFRLVLAYKVFCMTRGEFSFVSISDYMTNISMVRAL